MSSSSLVPNSTDNEDVIFSKLSKPYNVDNGKMSGFMFKVPEPISLKRKSPTSQDTERKLYFKFNYLSIISMKYYWI